ncbi:MAG: J domain-containing protein, partial [Thermomicrobiales bacterium]
MQAIVRSLSAEDIEYAHRLEEIEQRKRRIVDVQADLEMLKVALARFELEYRARVGPVLAEIERIRLELAEYRRRIAWLRAGVDPDPAGLERELDEEFATRREEVEAEAEEARRYQRDFRRERARPPLTPDTEEEVRRLYRDLAKRFHPDLATAAEERTRREEVMLRVNALFRERDLAGLRRLARETERDDPTFEERTLAEKLAWSIRESERLASVIVDLEAQVALLRQNDTYQFWHASDVMSSSIARLAENAREKRTRLQQRLADRTLIYRRMLARRRWRKTEERGARDEEPA